MQALCFLEKSPLLILRLMHQLLRFKSPTRFQLHLLLVINLYFLILIIKAEGARAVLHATITVLPYTPELTAPSQILRTLNRGSLTFLEIPVENNGLVAATFVRLNLPPIPWMSATSQTVYRLLPGEKTIFTVQLNPTAQNSVLQPYVGNLVISSHEQNLMINFNFIVVSNLTGSLQVEGTS